MLLTERDQHEGTETRETGNERMKDERFQMDRSYQPILQFFTPSCHNWQLALLNENP